MNLSTKFLVLNTDTVQWLSVHFELKMLLIHIKRRHFQLKESLSIFMVFAQEIRIYGRKNDIETHTSVGICWCSLLVAPPETELNWKRKVEHNFDFNFVKVL